MSAQGDCEFLVQRARELVPQDLWAAKAWLITARSLYPADFNIQVRPGGRARGARLPLPCAPLPIFPEKPAWGLRVRPGRPGPRERQPRCGGARAVCRGGRAARGGGGRMGVSWVPARASWGAGC